MAFYEVEKLTDILCEYKITPNQFYYLWILVTKRHKLLYKYIQESIPTEKLNELLATAKKQGSPIHSPHSIKAEEMKDLIDRGFIKTVKGLDNTRKNELDMYEVTPKFYKKIFVSTNIAGEELWEAYPAFLYINGNRVSARGADKEKLVEVYAKKIKNNIETHNEIIEIIKLHKDNLNMGIDKFVNTEYWNDLFTVSNNIVNYGTDEI